jgi:hypothetical protein
MADIAETKMISRRTLIKGVIASGATVSSASYVFRASTLLGEAHGPVSRRRDLKDATHAGIRTSL